MKVEFLEKERPVFTRALVEPWRLLALLVVSRIRRASVFRVPNAIYSAPLYFLLGFAMNLEFRQSSERKETCHG